MTDNTDNTDIEEFEEISSPEEAGEVEAGENAPEEIEVPKRKRKEKVEEGSDTQEETVDSALVASETNSEINPDELVAKKTSRFAQEVEKASSKDKKAMYRSERIYTEDADEDVETDATILRKDYMELVASVKSLKILKGKITGFRYAGAARKSTVLAEVEYGSGLFLVLIPSYLLYDYEVTDIIDPDKMQQIENNIKRRIGSDVRFIARHVDEKEQIAYADRLQAQSITARSNFIKPLADGVPRIVNGEIVKGQVIYTTTKGIIVDALGIDVKIPKDELSHSYVGNARDECKVGEYVNVKVSEIKEISVTKNGTPYRLITASGSIKAASPNHKAKLYDQIKIDSINAAEITYIEEAGVFCRLRGGVDCLCALPRFGENPKRGDTRLVKITDKVDDKLFLYGIFVKG